MPVYNKRTHPEYIELVKQKYGNKVKVLGKYIGARESIKHRCSCGNSFNRDPSSLLNQGYIKCVSCKRLMCAATRNATEKARYDKKLLAVKGENIIRIGVYKDGYTEIRHKCVKHNFIFKIAPNVVLTPGSKTSSTFKCNGCNKERLCRYNQMIPRISAINFPGYSILSPIKGDTGKLVGFKAECDLHGKYDAKAVHFLYGQKYHGCDLCARAAMGSVRTETVKIGNKSFKVQGYERHALPVLLKKHKSKLIPGLHDRTTSIKYFWKGKQRVYFPDFVVKDSKAVYEVKSIYTLLANRSVLSRNKAKAKAVGPSFKLLVYNNNGNRLPVPRRWLDMTLTELRNYYK